MKNSKENKTISKTKQNVIQNFEHKKYHSQNYPSNNFLFVLIMFIDHENIDNKPKIMILLCTVQKLWPFSLCPNMVI